MTKHVETLGVDGLNPLNPDAQSAATPIAQEAKFRTGMVSLLAAAIGMMAGIIAYLLYNLIGLFTNIAFYHKVSFVFRSARENHLGLLGHRDSGDRRNHRRHHGALRLRQDSRTRHSRGDGGGAGQPQPH